MQFDVIEQKPSSLMPGEEVVRVDLILHDGTRLSGWIDIAPYEAAQDMLNDPRQFFSITLENKQRLLVNKESVAICKPLGD